ncbi:MAG TPA: tRNA glutamyl-Q(34) synthetase GluQRS [Isosphaeraceae bacterium]
MSAPTSPRTVGRLAPSPTGGLHLGHARTFLIAWLAARRAGGRILLRIEDLDATRVRPEAAAGAIADLRWLGLDWDEGPDVGGPAAPYVQSERMEAYAEALERLKRSEMVYPCTCTRADIERAATAPHAGDEGPTYPGTCAGRTAGEARHLGDRPYAWRFRVPPGPVGWVDLVRGPVGAEPARVGGDFVVGRSNGTLAYQLAVVHDDATMGVTQVIRGDDLVPSTPRQILLYRALGWEPPAFGHVPLAVGPDGRRLAKRDGAIKLAALRAAGVDPQVLVGRLARSCGWADAAVPSSPLDWIGRVDFAALPREPWVVTPADLAPAIESRCNAR